MDRKVTVRCPYCGKFVTVDTTDESEQLKALRCPGCMRLFVIQVNITSTIRVWGVEIHKPESK